MSAATTTNKPSEPQAEQQSTARKPGLFARLARRLRGLHLPAWAAIITAILLLLLLLFVSLLFLLDPDHVPWRHSLTAGRIAAVLLLMVAIPLVVYKGLRLWLEGERSQFPEIDFAWRAGLEALERGGLSLDAVPVFLVLGSASESFEQSLLAASGESFRVRGVPEGPAPLHWYANPGRIVLVCSDVGWLSALSTLVAQTPLTALTEEVSSDETPPPTIGNRSGEEQLLKVGRNTTDALGTVETVPPRPKTRRVTPLRAIQAKPAVLTKDESAAQIERLRYVCRLIRHGRHPLCGINGLLTLLPINLFAAPRRENEAAPWREGNEWQKALRADLAIVQGELRLQCAVMTLIVGMEQARGFRELVRRVGRDRAAVQRLGRDFDLRALPTREALNALYIHNYSTFEDWIYTLFREQGVLSRPGNRQLYSLLCNFRNRFKNRFAAVLAGGYGYDPEQPRDEPILYGGCYFAATGETEDRQAFVRGVFDKLEDEQEEVQWTRQALINESRDRRLAALGIGVCAVLVMTLGAMILQAILW